MAERRMFAKTIVDSDVFLDMPLSAQALYFHLSMRADDDGFVNNTKNIMRMIGVNEDDIKILITKKFILPFENGIIVIKHWKIHNYIQNDRYKETKYKEEKSKLALDENNSYSLNSECIQNGYNMDTQVRLGKDRLELGKDSIDNIVANENLKPVKEKELQKPTNVKHKYGEYKHVMLKDEELQKLQAEYQNWQELITYLDEYIEMKGYKAVNHYLAIKKWVIKAVASQNTSYSNTHTKFQQNLQNLYKEAIEYDKATDITNTNSFG